VNSPLDSIRSWLYLRSESAAEHYVDEIVDGSGRLQYLDKPLSMSALTETETDYDYDPTHIELNRRLIPHGS